MAHEWACTVAEGRQVRLTALTFEVAITIEQMGGAAWLAVFNAPLRHPAGAKAVYEACCAHVGVEPRSLTVADMLAMFELVEDDRPTEYDGGVPKGEGSPATIGSS